jgi:hypothetical protein
VVLVSYPTPTALYRATRRVLEYLGLWGFPDERPLRYTEIARTAGELGEPIATRILWPMLLTQQVAVFRRR